MFELVLAPLLPLAAPCTVTVQPAVLLAGADVFLTDILGPASAACAPGGAATASPIARIPASAMRVELSRAQLAGLAHRQIPGLEVACGSPSDCGATVVLVAARRETDGAVECAVLVRARAGGEIIAPVDTAPANCAEGAGAPPVRYDPRDQVLRAAQALEPGTPLGRIRPPAPPGLLAGDTVTVASQVGPVRVEQDAVLLQAARAGEKVFVRTASGSTLSVEVPAGQEASP